MPNYVPHPSPVGECRVATQVVYRGRQTHSVVAVAGSVSPTERPHVAMRVGRCLVYFESRDAVDDFAVAFSRAWCLAEQLFPEPPDAFEELDDRARRRFEKTGDVKHLRR